MKIKIKPFHFNRIERDINSNPQYSVNIEVIPDKMVVEAFGYKKRGLFEVIISTYNVKEECKLINEFKY